MATSKVKTGGTGFDYNQEFNLVGNDGLNQTYGGGMATGDMGMGNYMNSKDPKGGMLGSAGANLGMGGAQTMEDFGKQWAQQNYPNSNYGGAAQPAAQPANPYIASSGLTPAQELQSLQGNINQRNYTEAQGRAEFGNEAVDNAIAKGAKFFSGGVTDASNTQFLGNNQGQVNPKMDSYQKNPYLDQMAQGITQQMNDNWSRNIAPSLRSGAMAAGGFGGSRQGVVEANALNDMNRSLGQNLTQFYGQDWTNDRNRNLQKYGMDQSYNLGMANNNLGFANLDSNNAQFGQSFGLNVLNAQNQWANNGVAAANQIQQQPLNYFNNTNANTMAAAGTGQPNQVAAQGNPWMAGAGAGLSTYGAMQNFNRGNRGYAGGSGTYEYQNPNDSTSPW